MLRQVKHQSPDSSTNLILWTVVRTSQLETLLLASRCQPRAPTAAPAGQQNCHRLATSLLAVLGNDAPLNWCWHGIGPKHKSSAKYMFAFLCIFMHFYISFSGFLRPYSAHQTGVKLATAARMPRWQLARGTDEALILSRAATTCVQLLLPRLPACSNALNSIMLECAASRSNIEASGKSITGPLDRRVLGLASMSTSQSILIQRDPTAYGNSLLSRVGEICITRWVHGDRGLEATNAYVHQRWVSLFGRQTSPSPASSCVLSSSAQILTLCSLKQDCLGGVVCHQCAASFVDGENLESLGFFWRNKQTKWQVQTNLWADAWAWLRICRILSISPISKALRLFSLQPKSFNMDKSWDQPNSYVPHVVPLQNQKCCWGDYSGIKLYCKLPLSMWWNKGCTDLCIQMGETLQQTIGSRVQKLQLDKQFFAWSLVQMPMFRAVSWSQCLELNLLRHG